MKINQTKNLSSDKKTEGSIDLGDGQNSPPIKIAIMLQQFWKNTGFLYQGLLGGLALMHFIMVLYFNFTLEKNLSVVLYSLFKSSFQLHVFFNNSMEFIMKYSTFCEIYTNIFSFLIVMCIVTTFDRYV